MEESERTQFMAKYGPREHAISIIYDHNTHPYTVEQAMKNPAITHDDLIRMAYHHDHNVSHPAIRRAQELGIGLSWSDLGKKK